MEGASEYVFVGGPRATFDALSDVVGQRRLSVVEEDPRHRRLAVLLHEPHQNGRPIKALCTSIDLGHGLSKLVALCVDEASGDVVTPGATLMSLFIEVEHALHSVSRKQEGALVGQV